MCVCVCACVCVTGNVGNQDINEMAGYFSESMKSLFQSFISTIPYDLQDTHIFLDIS